MIEWRALDTTYAVGEFRLQLWGWELDSSAKTIAEDHQLFFRVDSLLLDPNERGINRVLRNFVGRGNGIPSIRNAVVYHQNLSLSHFDQIRIARAHPLKKRGHVRPLLPPIETKHDGYGTGSPVSTRQDSIAQ